MINPCQAQRSGQAGGRTVVLGGGAVAPSVPPAVAEGGVADGRARGHSSRRPQPSAAVGRAGDLGGGGAAAPAPAPSEDNNLTEDTY